MAARATWKGYLKVSLVNIPIKVFPATESSATISFNQLHARVPDAHPAEAVVPALRARGAEQRARQGLRVREGPLRRPGRRGLREGHEPSRPASSTSSSSRTTSAIDPMYVDRAYYLAPDGGVAAEAFAVMREGMKGKVGDRQARAVRPRVPRRGAAARQGHRHVHAASRGRNPQHRSGRGAELGAVEGEARGDEARQAGDRDVRGAART